MVANEMMIDNALGCNDILRKHAIKFKESYNNPNKVIADAGQNFTQNLIGIAQK